MAAPSRWTCPSEDALYRFSTGDAPRWRRARLQRHLDRCAACAARLDAWDTATAAYRALVIGASSHVRRDDGRDSGAGDGVSARLVVRASAAGHDSDGIERARLARFEARLRREPAPSSSSLGAAAVLALPRLVPKPTLGWRTVAAALVLVAGAAFGFLPLQETITADALVARAVANDRQCPCPRADMVTIAASTERDTAASAVMTGDTSAPHGLMSERGTHARELAERLAEYAFDWQAPLSARPYQQWRSAITTRTESYDWIASDRVRVSTHAASGRIARAELILRTTDYRPVGQTWQFADGFAVELRLFERAVPAAPSPIAPSLNHIAAAGGAAGAPAARTIEETEVALRVSLERAGVVLTRRLTLRDNGERLTISGRAARPDVRRIATAAEEIGNIGVDVRADARRTTAAPGPSEAGDALDVSRAGAPNGNASIGSMSSRPVPGGSVSAGIDAWLDRTFGTSGSRAAFLPAARDLFDAYADAVAALDGLAQRFPAGATGPARARDDVRWLTAAYYGRVTASYERLEAHLAPLTGSVSRRILSAAAPSPSRWRTTSAAIAPAMRALSLELAAITSADAATADDFERAAGPSLRTRLVAVVPR